MWQAKNLREGISGSVAMIELTGGFFGSVAGKGLAEVDSRQFKVDSKREEQESPHAASPMRGTKVGTSSTAFTLAPPAYSTPPLNGKECGSD
jgi:hypothetical protein